MDWVLSYCLGWSWALGLICLPQPPKQLVLQMGLQTTVPAFSSGGNGTQVLILVRQAFYSLVFFVPYSLWKGIGEVEAGRSWISGQPGLYIRKLSQSNKPRNQTDCSFCFHSSTGVSYIVSYICYIMVCILCARPMYYWVSVYIAYLKRFIIFISWIWMFCLPVYRYVCHVCGWYYGGSERMLNSLELEFYTLVSCCVGTGN